MSSTGEPYAALSPYAGREADLDRLRQRLEEAALGQGGIVILRGPGGIGTTRTAHELAATADRLAMLVLWGRFRESVRGRPYGALAEALEEHAASLEEATLAGQLGDAAAPLIRLVPRLSLALSELRPPAPLEARDERLRLHSAVLDWLSAASRERPLLLVLDDGQWADADSLDLLAHVARRAADMRLLVLLTQAVMPSDNGGPFEAYAAPARARLEALPQSHVVELGGLSREATAAALEPLSDEPLTTEAVTLIEQLTGGHPLWARELYRHLRDENRLDGIHGRGLPTAAELPQTLEQLLVWRTSRLSPEVRSVLAAVAAFDHGATPSLVAEVGGLPRSRVLEFLEAASAAGLCRMIEQGQRYAIGHDRLRLGLLASLSSVQRAHLHRRAADALQLEPAGQDREHAGELLYHYHRSAALDGAERGIRHGLLAAEQARAAYARLRAAACLQICLELTAPFDRPMTAELTVRLAQMQAEAGLRREAVASAAAALREQRRLGTSPREALEPLVATLRVVRGDGLPEPEQEPVESLRRLGLENAARADPLVRARLEVLGERWQEVRNGSLAFLSWSVVGSDETRILTDNGTEDDVAELLLAQRPRDRQQSAAAARQARSWRKPSAVLRAMRAVVTDLVTRHGLFPEAASWAALYEVSSRRYGSPRDRLAALAMLARCHAVLGNFAAAEDVCGQAERLLAELPPDAPADESPNDAAPNGEASHDDLRTELLLSRLVLAHYVDGDWLGLAHRLAAALARRHPTGLIVGAELALAHARSGNETEARQLLVDVLEACAGLPPLTFYRDAALLGALSVAWELGAAEHSARGRSLLRLAAGAHVGSQPSGSLRLAEARLLALVGDVIEARRLLAEERTALDAAGLRPLSAIADHDEALAIAADAAEPSAEAEATALLERAAAAFDTLGMHGWEQRTRMLLEGGLAEARLPGGRLHFTYPLGLSRREVGVVRLVVGGAALPEAAEALQLDEAAARRYLSSAMEKLGTPASADLPRVARQHGLVGA